MRPPTPHMGLYIDRPAQDVWDYVLDIGRTPEWRPRMSRVEWITEGDPGVDSRFRVSAKALLYTFKFELEVTSWEPPHYFAYTGKQGPVLIDAFMEFLSDNEGSRFFIGGSPKANNWIMRTLEPLFWLSLLRHNLADFERLKQIMESGRDRIGAS